MSKRGSAIALLAILLAGAALIARSCLSHEESPKEISSARPGTASPSVRKPGPAPAPNAAGSAAEGGAAPVTAFSTSWGAALGQLGRDRPAEGNPEGPMSLAVDRKGRVLLLDQVNSRIVRYGKDGKPEAFKASRTTQDVAVGDDGTIAAMDRFTDKAVTLYDDSGEVLGQLPLEGEGIENAGEVTGVFVDGKDVYAERMHGPLVRLGDTSGTPADPRTEIPGRPSRDGLSYVSAGITDAEAGRAYVTSTERATMSHRFTRELRLEAMILTIVLLDTDRSGIIYFAAQLQEAPDDELIQLTCLDPVTGQPLGTAMMPANTLPEETFRDLAVLDEGGVIYALRSESGVTYKHYDCR